MAAPKRPVGSKSDKLWRDAISRAVHRIQAGKKTKFLETIANRLVKEAANGDLVAMKEIGDRLDGRATQQIDVRRINSVQDLTDDELAALSRGSD